MSIPFPEPTTPVSSRAEVFLTYLDYFRSRLVNKLEALPGGELRRSRLEYARHVGHLDIVSELAGGQTGE